MPKTISYDLKNEDDMIHDSLENREGPQIGAPAPFCEAIEKEGGITLNNLKGCWVILFSHPEDLIPVFKTATINYLLCKRRIKAVAVGHKDSMDANSSGNFFEKFAVNHSFTVIDDKDNQIAARYGLNSTDEDEPMKGVFVIDPKGYLRMKLMFSLESERNFTEILKLVDVLQVADKQSKKKKQNAVGKGFKLKWGNLFVPDTTKNMDIR